MKNAFARVTTPECTVARLRKGTRNPAFLASSKSFAARGVVRRIWPQRTRGVPFLGNTVESASRGSFSVRLGFCLILLLPQTPIPHRNHYLRRSHHHRAPVRPPCT